MSITEIPIEKENRKKWQAEKNKLMKAFDRVLVEKDKYEKNPTNYKIEGIFYDPNDYNLLTNHLEPNTLSIST